MEKGKLITFEGIDGSGKTTQIRYLDDYLRSLGFSTLLLREPGGTRIGEGIRRLLLDSRFTEMTSETELFLFEAARAQLIREIVRPALDRGVWVISDRFHDSTVAYQGYGRGLDVRLIRDLNQLAMGGTVPDLTILLELPQDTRSARLDERHEDGRSDRLNVEPDAFKQRVCQGFRAIAREEPSRVVSIRSQEEKEETARLIREQVRSRLL